MNRRSSILIGLILMQPRAWYSRVPDILKLWRSRRRRTNHAMPLLLAVGCMAGGSLLVVIPSWIDRCCWIEGVVSYFKFYPLLQDDSTLRGPLKIAKQIKYNNKALKIVQMFRKSIQVSSVEFTLCALSVECNEVSTNHFLLSLSQSSQNLHRA